MTLDQILEFRFSDQKTQEQWAFNAPKIYKAIVEEMGPVVKAALNDNEAEYKARLREYQQYLNRLAFIRAQAENFNQVAYSQQLIMRSAQSDGTGKPIGATLAKEMALQDTVGPMYLAALSRWLWDSLREGKSSIQSLLAAERESKWTGTGAQ